MKSILRAIGTIGLCALFTVALTGCPKDEKSSLEKAGDAVKEGAEKTGDAVKEGAEKAGDAVKEGVEAVKDAAEGK